MTITLNDSNFNKEVIGSDMPVMVEFWAPWCQPCRILSPTFDEVSQELEGKAKVCKINTDENPKKTKEYHIQGIPNIIVFNNGEIVDQVIGAVTKGKLLDMLKKVGIGNEDNQSDDSP